MLANPTPKSNRASGEAKSKVLPSMIEMTVGERAVGVCDEIRKRQRTARAILVDVTRSRSAVKQAQGDFRCGCWCCDGRWTVRGLFLSPLRVGEV